MVRRLFILLGLTSSVLWCWYLRIETRPLLEKVLNRPEELHYLEYFVFSVSKQMEQPQIKDSMDILLRYAWEAGSLAVEKHPNDTTSHYIFGLAELNYVKAGYKYHIPACRLQLKEALWRDPTFIPTIDALKLLEEYEQPKRRRKIMDINASVR